MVKLSPYWAVVEMNRQAFESTLDRLRSIPAEAAIRKRLAERLCVYSQAVEFYIGPDSGKFEVEFLERIADLFDSACKVLDESVLPTAVVADRTEIEKFRDSISRRAVSLRPATV